MPDFEIGKAFVSVGLRGDNLDEWGALVRISFLVDNVTD